MSQSNKIKQNIVDQIDHITKTKDFVLSTTIVGSFNTKGLESISDIDIVIIVDQLNKKKYDTIITDFKNINTNLLGLKNFKLKVNSCFGPLKFDGEKIIVFHVMVYDINGHIKHVKESPFTCHSWEQNQPLNGKSLSDIYPVVTINFSDIFNSRRGLDSYLNDLKKDIITYREYEFSGSIYSEKKQYFKLDHKHKFEYSYHIIFNLLNNFYKIITQENNTLNIKQLVDFFNELNIRINFNLLIRLNEWKISKKDIQFDVIKETTKFLNYFFEKIEKEYESIPSVLFLRHQKTILNDGTFLGVRRNPSIISFENNNKETFIVGYHSQLKRSKETLQKFHCLNLVESKLLNEIDYGKIEGESYENLKIKFPEIIREWEENKDPKFPDGESQSNVLLRIQTFLNETLDKSVKTIVVTHLVAMRLILYNLLNLSLPKIYKIQINHLEGFEFKVFKGYLVPNLQNEFISALRKNLSSINV